MKITRDELASMIDETMLDPSASEEDIRTLCERSEKFGFATIAILPCNVAIAKKYLDRVKICAAIGFPLGSINPEAKFYEAEDAVKNGAHEIDFVVNIGALKDGNFDLIKHEFQGIKESSQGRIVKVILEISLLTEDEARIGCELADEVGLDFVKSSTGFKGFPIRPTSVEDVSFMKKHVSNRMKIKAAGGIRNLEDALAMIEAGANRLGTSSGKDIVEGL